jgi:hypothetical protein
MTQRVRDYEGVEVHYGLSALIVGVFLLFVRWTRRQ